jgi:hypothetical protein
MMCGVILAFLAAVLAITDLASGRFEGNQSHAESEKTNAYSWYESKSIKQTLVEGQRDLLSTLLNSGEIQPGSRAAMSTMLTELDAKAIKYEKEKNEILLGSSVVGQENWAQDVNGELGKIVGAEEWKAQEEALDNAGDIFDMSGLFLQLSLVLGAIALVFQHDFAKRLFFGGMVLLGATGLIVSIYAFTQGMAVQ